MSLRSVRYGRISSEDQSTYSIEAQDTRTRVVEAARGYIHIRHYIDDGWSGTSTERPGLKQLLADAKAGEFDVIVVDKLDRFTRNLVDVILLLADLSKYNVALVSATEPLDFTNPIGKALLIFLVFFAQWYIENLSQETIKGKRRKAEAGYQNNRPPLGYVFPDKTSDDGRRRGIEAVPVQSQFAPIAVQMFEAYSTGQYSRETLSEWMQREHHIYIRPDTVAKMLSNRFYVGEVSYRGVVVTQANWGKRKTKLKALADTIWYPGKHEAIISMDLFEKCQAIRTKRSSHHGAQPSRVYLFTRLAVCSVCGLPMRSGQVVDRGEVSAYYCAARYRGHACDAPRSKVRESMLALQVDTLMRRLALSSADRDDTLMRLGGAGEAERIEQRREQLGREIKRIKFQHQKGWMKDKEAEREMKRIDVELSQLVEPDKANIDKAAEVLQSMSTAWGAMLLDERAAVLHAMMEKIIVDVKRKLIVAFVPHADFAPLFAECGLRREREGYVSPEYDETLKTEVTGFASSRDVKPIALGHWIPSVSALGICNSLNHVFPTQCLTTHCARVVINGFKFPQPQCQLMFLMNAMASVSARSFSIAF